MKRKWQHPEDSKTGKQYWRSLDELAETPQFNEWLEREFPAGAQEMEMNDISRRSFLRLMGGSLALAGLGMSGCRRPEAFIVPYTNSPEWIVPGKITLYSSSMPRRRGAVSVQATTYEGRPTKLDGNPLLNSGLSDSHVQASILDLYDPDRTRFFKKDGKKTDVQAFSNFVEETAKNFAATQGEGLAVLTESSTSPTIQRLRAEFKSKFPKAIIASYEPISNEVELKATEIAFGQRYQILPQYEKADVIFALQSDFLSTEEGGIEAVKSFAARRRVRKSGDTMNRLYVAESRITNTGGMADHRLRIKASLQPAFLAILAKEMASNGAGAELATIANSISSGATLSEVQQRWAREVAIDLLKYGKGLVVVGSQQTLSVQLLGIAINQALGAYRNGLIEVIAPVQIASSSLQDLAASIKSNSVKTLFILGGNPAYNAPADLEWAALQKSVPQVVRVSNHDDETTQVKADWIAPLAHFLESWGDARAIDGTYLAQQPMILPLLGGVSEIQIFAALLGQKECLLPTPTVEPAKVATPTLPGQASPVPIPLDMLVVQKTFMEVTKSNEWNKFLHDGFWSGSAFAPVGAAYRSSAVVEAIKQNLPAYQEGVEVTFYPCPKVDDGRYANNGWLQEVPDVQSKLTWDNAAFVSVATAQKLGLKIKEYPSLTFLDPKEVQRRKDNPTLEIDDAQADVIVVEIDGRSVEVPVYVMPGQADDSLAIALGYGRTFEGFVGKNVGSNLYKIRTSTQPYIVQNAKISRANKSYELAQTQLHHSMEGRAIVRELTLEEFTKNAAIVKKMGIDGHQPEDMRSLYETEKGTGHKPVLTDPHQWGMVIDLSTCVGCTACVVACQSENNIPIVGKDQVKRGRSMHWMRIDRYFSESPSDPQVALQPMLCQHCENAPCETVCPVNATVHSDDGLNVMAYNRCIGTRYCANNCPYKVRRFNFFDYNKRKVTKKGTILGFDVGNLYFGPFGEQNDDKMIEMQKNPNVTVRMRGVMEKCSFCVQRIEESKINALRLSKNKEKQKVATDSFKTACQQACPAEAIVFGDIANPESQVTKLRALDQNYGVLSYLGTMPRVTYLARVRNPNPLMPDADKFGLGSDWDTQSHLGSHGGGHGDAHGAETKKEAHH